MVAYQNAQDDLIKDALEAEPVAVALLTLLTPDTPYWTGTASELLSELTAHAYGEKRPPKGWPGAPHVLAGALKRIAPALLAQGVEVTQLSRDGKKGSKHWQIRTVEESKRQKHQKEHKKAEDTVLYGISATDARAVASSVKSDSQASAEKARRRRQDSSTDASDAPKPTSSKRWEMEI